MNEQVLIETNFPTLKPVRRGKVRDIYEVDDGRHLLIVATDRLSAFDVVMRQGIPFKGKVLTQISKYWFDLTADIVPNHLVTTDADSYPEECRPYCDVLEGRSMLVKKMNPLPIEWIVRGYLSGSGWKEYQEHGTVCSLPLAEGLLESAKLPQPIFTPSTKAEIGVHDENISFDGVASFVGRELAEEVRDLSTAIYDRAMEIAEPKGIIIADTKMEFGVGMQDRPDDGVVLIDELLTPDSSRLWPKDKYQQGRSQESFDKQYVRDYLLSVNFNRKPPPPDLPIEVIQTTSEKYLEALFRLTGRGVE
jgi:phosphoribosylaminoimidazole-succinocarboxamide synthase